MPEHLYYWLVCFFPLPAVKPVVVFITARMLDIDYNRVFEVLDRVTGLPLRRQGNRWYGACYITGEPHIRRDKTVCRIAPRGDGIQILEAGGDAMTLWNWLLTYGGCHTGKEAKDRLVSLSSGIIVPPAPVVHGGLYVPYRDFESTKSNKKNDNLFKYLTSIFTLDKVEHVFDLYNVASMRLYDGRIGTCYWYMDSERRVLHDKIVLYKSNGHRDKTFGGCRRFRTADGYSNRCLFGAHLLSEREEGQRVVVVEAEKTALLLALRWPKHIYLATGGANNTRLIEPYMELWPDYDDAGMIWVKKWPDQCKRWWEWYDGVEKGMDIGDVIIKKQERVSKCTL